jgi:hypothetical protein
LRTKYDPDVFFLDITQLQILLDMVDSAVFGICDPTSPFFCHLSCYL